MQKAYLKKLLSEDQISRVIELLGHFQTTDNLLEEEIVLVSAQYYRLEKHQRRNLIAYEEYNILSNKICQTLLWLIDKLPDDRQKLNSFRAFLKSIF